jgi:hypothetical protein
MLKLAFLPRLLLTPQPCRNWSPNYSVLVLNINYIFCQINNKLLLKKSIVCTMFAENIFYHNFNSILYIFKLKILGSAMKSAPNLLTNKYCWCKSSRWRRGAAYFDLATELRVRIAVWIFHRKRITKHGRWHATLLALTYSPGEQTFRNTEGGEGNYKQQQRSHKGSSRLGSPLK